MTIRLENGPFDLEEATLGRVWKGGLRMYRAARALAKQTTGGGRKRVRLHNPIVSMRRQLADRKAKTLLRNIGQKELLRRKSLTPSVGTPRRHSQPARREHKRVHIFAPAEVNAQKYTQSVHTRKANQLKQLIQKQNAGLLNNQEMQEFALLSQNQNVQINDSDARSIREKVDAARSKLNRENLRAYEKTLFNAARIHKGYSLEPSRDVLKQRNEERLKQIRNKAESIRQRRRWYQRYSAKNMGNINELIKEENKKMLTNNEVEKRRKTYNQAMSNALANVIEYRSGASRQPSASASRRPGASASRQSSAYKEFKRRGGVMGASPVISKEVTLRYVTPNGAYYPNLSGALRKMGASPLHVN